MHAYVKTSTMSLIDVHTQVQSMLLEDPSERPCARCVQRSLRINSPSSGNATGAGQILPKAEASEPPLSRDLSQDGQKEET